MSKKSSSQQCAAGLALLCGALLAPSPRSAAGTTRGAAPGITARVAAEAATWTATIVAGRDATMIENADGALANGSGPYFFAGRNNQAQDSVRRALVWFDVAGSLPPGAIVQSARLVLFMTPSNPETREMRLHRVLADWSEGPSSSAGGGGAPSEPGDVTWIHTLHPVDFWLYNGAQFAGEPSARAEVGATGTYVWQSSELTRDVRVWSVAPALNFGWILIGDETLRQTAKSFASRENPDETIRPVLEVTYRKLLQGP